MSRPPSRKTRRKPSADVVVALDFPDRSQALALVDALGESGTFYKVGLELYTRAGASVIEDLRARDKRVFLDLKLHDIPHTVAGAVRAASAAGVDLLTVHTAGGRAMMEAAAAAVEDREGEEPGMRLLGVTILTSFSAADVEATWGRTIHSLREEVVRLAELASESGLDGVVASPLEARSLRRRLGRDFIIVTPGIRLAGGDRHDQTRVATPAQAVDAGSDLLVVGRSVTAAPDPAAALQRIRNEMRAPTSGEEA